MVGRTLIAVALATLFTVGCKRKPPADPALAVPYPIGDVVPNPPARNALARNGWVYVAVDSRDPVAQLVARDRPAATFHIVGADDNRALGLHRLFGSKGPKRDEIVVVEHDKLRSIGAGTSAPHVWLIGRDGPCRAKIGEASVGYYDDVAPTFDVGFALEGCDGNTWAPVGSLAPELPAALRYERARTVLAEDFPAGERWSSELAQVANIAELPNARNPVAESAFARMVDALTQRPTSITHIAYETGANPCDLQFEFAATYGLWREGQWTNIEPAPELELELPLELLGVFVEGDRIEGMAFHYGEDALVSFAPTNERGDAVLAGFWRAQEVSTGVHDPYAWRENNFVGQTDTCDDAP